VKLLALEGAPRIVGVALVVVALGFGASAGWVEWYAEKERADAAEAEAARAQIKLEKVTAGKRAAKATHKALAESYRVLLEAMTLGLSESQAAAADCPPVAVAGSGGT
jgi:hypothetical protein